MKHKISHSQAEQNAQKLRQLSNAAPDKRELLRGIVQASPADISRSAQLNEYFASSEQEPAHARAGWLAGTRAYAGLAVIALVILGGGALWFNFSRPSSAPTPSQFSTSDTAANGKVANTVNAITQQTSSEASTALSSQLDTSTSSAASNQINQMQDSINEKF